MYKKRIENVVKGIEVGFQCEAKVDFGAMYYQVYNDAKLTREFMEFVKNQTDVNVIECREAMTGEDFGYMLKEIPGFHVLAWSGIRIWSSSCKVNTK